MPAALQLSTLLYCFNERDEVLLMRRVREPNSGCWSPCGGKVDVEAGESPHACAIREAGEELGVRLGFADLHLTGLVSERGRAGAPHWLMFLFEVRKRLKECPPHHPEGEFAFFEAGGIERLELPQTDREQIWPLFWEHRGGFFAAHCRRGELGDDWTVEESHPC